MKFLPIATAAVIGLAAGPLGVDAAKSFNRISSFLVCSQIDADCNTDEATNAETLWKTKDDSTLVYSDAEGGNVGFVNIDDPANPVADGVVSLGGEPTTVRIHGDYGKIV